MITEEGLVINVQWSKTNQKHNFVRQIPLKRVEECALCRVSNKRMPDCPRRAKNRPGKSILKSASPRDK